MDKSELFEAEGEKAEREHPFLCKQCDIQNYQMLSKAEEIKEIYETIKSIPNPQSEVETEINGESSESVLQHQQVQTEESPKQQQETSNDL